MAYMEFDTAAYEQVKQAGFTHLHLGKQLANSDVGFDPGCMFGLFEVEPVRVVPPDTNGVYWEIGSPEAVDMANGAIDLVFHFMRVA